MSEWDVKTSWSFCSSQFTAKTVSTINLQIFLGHKEASVLNIKQRDIKQRTYLSNSAPMNIPFHEMLSSPDDVFSRVGENESGLKSPLSIPQFHIHSHIRISFHNSLKNCIQNKEVLHFALNFFKMHSASFSMKPTHFWRALSWSGSSNHALLISLKCPQN